MTDFNRFTKQSSEKYPIDVDFTDILGSGETITTAQVEVYEGISLATGIVDSYDTVNDTENGYYAVRIIVKDGVNKNTYKITVKVTTSDGNVYEDDVFMVIRDI